MFQTSAAFEVDREMSTIDNLDLHNKVTGETTISYKGTTDKVLKALPHATQLRRESVPLLSYFGITEQHGPESVR